MKREKWKGPWALSPCTLQHASTHKIEVEGKLRCSTSHPRPKDSSWGSISWFNHHLWCCLTDQSSKKERGFHVWLPEGMIPCFLARTNLPPRWNVIDDCTYICYIPPIINGVAIFWEVHLLVFEYFWVECMQHAWFPLFIPLWQLVLVFYHMSSPLCSSFTPIFLFQAFLVSPVLQGTRCQQLAWLGSDRSFGDQNG